MRRDRFFLEMIPAGKGLTELNFNHGVGQKVIRKLRKIQSRNPGYAEKAGPPRSIRERPHSVT